MARGWGGGGAGCAVGGEGGLGTVKTQLIQQKGGGWACDILIKTSNHGDVSFFATLSNVTCPDQQDDYLGKQ